MKRPLPIAVLLLSAVACQPGPPVFYVTAVHPDAPIDVEGRFQNKQYALLVDRETNKVPLYLAYYEPIDIDDVGKSFRAREWQGELLIEVPGKGEIAYSIKSVETR